MSLNFFSVGDVVIMKGTGGPAMTVCGLENDGYVFCKWFDPSEDLHSSNFHQNTLILIPQEER